ncbi:TPA: ATP-binding protein, partial [Escherichia coli]
IGKTHAIVSAALRRLEHGGFSLVVFGDDFGKAEPWEVLRSKIGLGAAIDRSTLFECIQACAEHTGLPFVIYIDALNESPREVRWKDKLPELLAQCKSYPDIKICVSTRDTYRNLVVDSRFPGFAFEHIGFSGHQFEAVQAFAAYYELDAEITPLFSPELGNPLFLHLACKTLKGEGRDSLDISLPGFTSLFQGHLKHCDVLIRERLHYANPRNLVRAAMMALAKTLTHELPQNRTWETCCEALSKIVGTETTPESFLNALAHEGLIILSVVDEDTFLIRLGYQRYGDILRAISLVETLDSDTVKLAEKIAALTEEDAGLLEALAAVLPEKTALEITAEEVGLPSEQAHKLFIQSLVWRSRQSVVEEIDEHIHAALHTPGLWESVYEALFSLSLVPDHRLNATNWLGPFLRQSSLAERDTYLSLAALGSFDNKTAVYSLIHAALFADITHWPAESRRLASLTLAWLTSCADRRIRDLSSKGLSRILANYPENCQTVISEFAYCDDDYVLERISLAIYSACLLSYQRRNAFMPALPGLLSIASDSKNILLRDTVQLLVNLLKTGEFPTAVTSQLQHYQTNVSLPSRWPVLADVKPLLDLEHLPSNMVLWGESMAPDFWRYQVESKISGFDLESANISHENIACWLMREALNLGYPGYNHCALNYDRHIGSQYGSGRGRKGYADRLGKKYYWIALHRLLGILASNVPALEDPYSDYEPTSDLLWSVDVRKVDLTDVRDITAEGVYPVLMEETNYAFPDHNSDIKGWVRTDDFPPYEACLIRTDEEGEQWVALSHSYWDDDKAPNENSWDSPYLGVRASYSSALINESIQNFKQKRSRDIFQYNQGSSCYRGYLAEYPDSPVYKQLLNSDEDSEAFNFTEVSLLRGNEWEYDYSYTMPERQDNLIAPCLGIIQKLELLWDCQSGWVDHSGKLIAFHQKGVKQRGLFIHRSALNAYLSITGEELIHRRFANRGYFDLAGRNSTQIDLKTWIQYRADKAPVVLREEELPFNC